jgi:predicted nucleotidyltransferase
MALYGKMPGAMAADTTALTPGLAERERVLRIIRAHAGEIRALGVARLWLFGSLARGEAGPESDVDVVIDIAPERRFSLLHLAEVRLACDLLGREAGVVIRGDLRPRFRDTIAGDLIDVL